MFLSIIVPVYNTEAYMEECLDSLIDQDIPSDDYEIICVDDGSTDGSAVILRRYEEAHENIRVIAKENGGVASARNAGLDAAKGDYIWFVDSDDFIRPDFLKMLREHILEHKTDRIMVGTYVFPDSELTVQNVIDRGDLLQVNSHFYDSSVWNSVLSRGFLLEHNCRFRHPELSHGEDTVFMFEAVAYNPSCYELDIPVYFYRNRPGSATTSSVVSVNERKVSSYIYAAKLMREYTTQNFGKPQARANLLMSYIWMSMSMCAELPLKRRHQFLREMKDYKLFPSQRPKECNLVKSYQTNRTDLIGKIFESIYMHTHTRFGFALMCVWKRAYAVYAKICK